MRTRLSVAALLIATIGQAIAAQRSDPPSGPIANKPTMKYTRVE